MIRITTTATARPISRLWNICFIGLTWPRSSTSIPLGGWPARAIAASMPVDRPAEVLALDVGRQAEVSPHVVAVDLAGHLAPHDAGDVADQQGRRRVRGRVGHRRPACWRLARVVSGTSATSVASVIFGGGTWTWTWYELPLTSSRQ